MDQLCNDVLMKIMSNINIIALRALASTCKLLRLLCRNEIVRLIIIHAIDIRKIIEFDKFLYRCYGSYGYSRIWWRNRYYDGLTSGADMKYDKIMTKIHPKYQLNIAAREYYCKRCAAKASAQY